MNKSIGVKIKNLRNSYKLTTQELADKVGVTRSQISKIETGVSMPSIEVLENICKAFKITLADFFSQDDNPVALTPELKELLDHARELTPEQLEKLTEFIKTMK